MPGKGEPSGTWRRRRDGSTDHSQADLTQLFGADLRSRPRSLWGTNFILGECPKVAPTRMGDPARLCSPAPQRAARRSGMPLPVRTDLSDIEAVCGYLITKPAGTSAELINEKSLDRRKLSALKFWG